MCCNGRHQLQDQRGRVVEGHFEHGGRVDSGLSRNEHIVGEPPLRGCQQVKQQHQERTSAGMHQSVVLAIERATVGNDNWAEIEAQDSTEVVTRQCSRSL